MDETVMELKPNADLMNDIQGVISKHIHLSAPDILGSLMLMVIDQIVIQEQEGAPVVPWQDLFTEILTATRNGDLPIPARDKRSLNG